MTARRIGLTACIIAVLLLGLSLFVGRKAEGAAMAQPAAAATPAAHADGLHVMDAWIRLPAATGRPAGGFLSIMGSRSADQLVGVDSPRAERIELHSMTRDNGVMRMRREDSLALPAGGTLALAPGGNHLMLFGLAPDVKAGDSIPLILRFKSGRSLSTEARTVAPAATPPAAMDHHDNH